MKYQSLKRPATTRNVQDYRLIALGIRKSNGRPWAILESKEVMQALNLTLNQTTQLFTRLHAQNRIQKLRRGLYIVPGDFPPMGKIWTPSPYEALWAYMDWLKAKWQITGLAAFTHYHFSTQIPQVFTVCNDKLSGEVEVGGSRFIFIKVQPKQIGNITCFSMIGGIEIPFSSKVRTVFDAIYYANRFGTIPSAYSWLVSITKNKIELDELLSCCHLYGNKQTRSRIGFMLEKLNVDASSLLPKEKKAKNTLIPFVPGPRRGTINKRWGVIENQCVNEILSELEVLDEDDV